MYPGTHCIGGRIPILWYLLIYGVRASRLASHAVTVGLSPIYGALEQPQPFPIQNLLFTLMFPLTVSPFRSQFAIDVHFTSYACESLLKLLHDAGK